MAAQTSEHGRRARRIETLVEEIEALPDAHARAQAQELIQSLLELYGEGLARMLELAGQDGAAGEALIEAFAGDELVGSLLLLHGLHPVDIETRIGRALDEVRPYLASHGGNVELLGVADGVASLRLQGSCHGCPASAVTLKLAIEEAIYKAAPDLDELRVEGVTEPPPQLITLVPARRSAQSARSSRMDQREPGEWTAIEDIGALSDGAVRAVEVQGRGLVFCRAGPTRYAYVNRCAGCGARLDDGRLVGATLSCPACGRGYDVSRAGRCVDAPELFLEPVPLLAEGDVVRVALPGLAGESTTATARAGTR